MYREAFIRSFIKTSEILLRPQKSNSGESWKIYNDTLPVGRIRVSNLGSVDIHVNKNMRGRGFGSKAMKALVSKTKQEKLTANIRRSNIPSIKAVERAGFVESGSGSGKQLLFTKELGKGPGGGTR